MRLRYLAGLFLLSLQHSSLCLSAVSQSGSQSATVSIASPRAAVSTVSTVSTVSSTSNSNNSNNSNNSSIAPSIREKITKSFNKSLPSLIIDKIEATPISHLYQITAGPVVMYVTEEGTYAIAGDLLDLKDGKTNFTEKARQKALINALDKLGESSMIIFSPPSSVKTKYTVSVFTDLECIYCQKLHAQIDKITQLGIKIRYIAFPKSGKNTSGYERLTYVWCAPDRKMALTQGMLGHFKPVSCFNHQIDKQFNLGAMAGVTGTPTFIIEGQLVPGYLDPETLLEVIQKMTKA